MDIVTFLAIIGTVVPASIALYHIYRKLIMHIDNDKNLENKIDKVIKLLEDK